MFGSRRPGSGGSQCQNHGCKDSRCSSASASTSSYPAGGALGQPPSSQQSNNARVAQPGMEMMPTSSHVGLAGLPLGGGGGGGGGGLGLLGVGADIEESLKGAPPDVLAAAERLSLIPSAMLGAGAGGGMAGVGVVNTAPGAESTDTGELSVSPPAAHPCTHAPTYPRAPYPRAGRSFVSNFDRWWWFLSGSSTIGS